MSCLFQLFTQNTRYPGVLSQYILTIIILFRVLLLLFFFFFFSLILFRLILPFEIQLSFTVKMMQLRDEEGSTPSPQPLSPPLSPPKARAEIKKTYTVTTVQGALDSLAAVFTKHVAKATSAFATSAFIFAPLKVQSSINLESDGVM